MTIKQIDTWDREGVFVLVAEGASQPPIVLETEGEFSSYEAAQERARTGPFKTRTCVCRLVPVSGNELVVLDMQRMQPEKEDTF